jgi:hypothetical protein
MYVSKKESNARSQKKNTLVGTGHVIRIRMSNINLPRNKSHHFLAQPKMGTTGCIQQAKLVMNTPRNLEASLTL